MGEEGTFVQVRIRRRDITFEVCLERAFCRSKPPTRVVKPHSAEDFPEQPRGGEKGMWTGVDRGNGEVPSSWFLLCTAPLWPALHACHGLLAHMNLETANMSDAVQ